MNNEQTTVAELLKSARVERKLSIKYVAADICVRSNYLTAIEAADYDALPGKTFAIGFVKSYATALGLDASIIIEAFKAEYYPEVSVLEKAPVIKPTKRSRKVPTWLAPIVGLAGASACWVLFGGGVTVGFMTSTVGINTVEVEEAQLAAVQANITEPVTAANDVVIAGQAGEAVFERVTRINQATISSSVTLDVVAETRPAQSFFAPAVYADGFEEHAIAGNYTLRAVEDSWVRVARTDGTEVWSGILREGQTYRPQADGVILLSTSNAGGVLLQITGGEAGSLGDRGAIVSELKLEDATLLTEQEVGELDEFGSE
tara:strand:- start:256 stop:1206 length:951 start_codon:yes stop_codon:yes gene_type:complete